MPNGKPGDRPLADILVHRSRVFSRKIDSLIREIDALGGRSELLNQINWFSPPPLPELERQPRGFLDRLKQTKQE